MGCSWAASGGGAGGDAPSPDPSQSPAKKRRVSRGRLADVLVGASVVTESPLVVDPNRPVPPDAGMDSQQAKEKEFFKFFEDLVCEWNPTFSSEGEIRYT